MISNQINNCYESVTIEGECVIRNRAGAEYYLNQSTSCVEYECSNSTGNISNRIKCRSDEEMICLNDEECVSKADTDKRTTVVLIMDNSTYFVNCSQVADEVSKVSTIDVTLFDIGIEYDDEGNTVRVIIYVDDLSTAKTIHESIQTKCIPS